MSFDNDRLRNGTYAPEVMQPGLEQVVRVSDKQWVDTRTAALSAPLEPPKASWRGFRGRTPFTTGLLLGLLVAIILAAAIGGGLGASLASCHNSSSSATGRESATVTVTVTAVSASPTSTSTSKLLSNFTVIEHTQIDTLANDCPSLAAASQRLQTVSGDVFIPDCNRGYSNGGPANEGGIIADIIGVISYTFADCMEACSVFNIISAKYGVKIKCLAVSFDLDMANRTATYGGNCWLKNGTLLTGTSGVISNLAMSAKLYIP